jgi:NAD(P)-dependent dehydrogenase (short-subunit alcohol dehydrogenase family)
VLPGAIDTPMLWDKPNVKSGDEKIDKADVGRPEDVADAVAYLASDQASFIQGTELPLMVAGWPGSSFTAPGDG